MIVREFVKGDNKTEISFSRGEGNFSLHHRVQIDSGIHTSSYPVGTGNSFPRDKAAGV